jgi:hypothetical protein
MKILRINRSTTDAIETTYEIPVPATVVATVAAIGTFGNFVVNLATHYPCLKALLHMT